MNLIDKIIDLARERRSRKAIEQMGSSLGAVVGDLVVNFHRSLQDEERIRAVAEVLATPAGQVIFTKFVSVVGLSPRVDTSPEQPVVEVPPSRHPVEARSIAMEELLGINSLTEWVKVGDGIAVPNIDSAKDDAYIDRVIARSKKAE